MVERRPGTSNFHRAPQQYEGVFAAVSPDLNSSFYLIEANSSRLIECIFANRTLARIASECGNAHVRVSGSVRSYRDRSLPAVIEVDRIETLDGGSDWDTTWEWDTKLD